MVDGRAKVELGRTVDGIAQIEQGIAERRSIGVEVGQPFWISLLAESYMLIGDFNKAIDVLNEAIKYSARSGDQFYLPEIYRIRGEAVSQHSDLGTSEEPAQSFDKALGLARQQGSKSLELRTANSMAKLNINTSKSLHARNLLASLHADLSDNTQTNDLSDAEKTLNAF